jgi:osmoprotectant transport system substrate-binding protein
MVRSRLLHFIVVLACAAGLGASLAACAPHGADQNGDQITGPLPATKQLKGGKGTVTMVATVTSTTTTGTATAATSTTITTATETTTVIGTTTIAEPVTTPEENLPGYHKPVVLLGDENTPEQFVLGQLYAYALRARGYEVAVSRNVGIPATTRQALKQGILDVYPAYLNDFDVEIAGIHKTLRDEREALAIARRYADRHRLVLLDPTPFSDTAALAVTDFYARNLNVHSLTALAGGIHPIVGVPLQYQTSRTGLPLLERVYGLHPAAVQQMAFGDQYSDLVNNVIQAAYVATTDPQLEHDGYTLLKDPRHVYGIGNVVPVTTQKVIKAEGPEFVATLNRVDALLTLKAIRGLNAEVELNHLDPSVAAREFLEANGLMPAAFPPGSN